MNNDVKAFQFAFVNLTTAKYEAQQKGFIIRLIRKCIDRTTNNHSISQYNSKIFYLPKGITHEDIQKLLSYYLKEYTDYLESLKTLSKQELINAKKDFAMNIMPGKLKTLGFKLAPLDTKAQDYCFVETNNFKNPSVEDSFKSWYNPDVDIVEVQSILSKLKQIKETQQTLL